MPVLDKIAEGLHPHCIGGFLCPKSVPKYIVGNCVDCNDGAIEAVGLACTRQVVCNAKLHPMILGDPSLQALEEFRWAVPLQTIPISDSFRVEIDEARSVIFGAIKDRVHLLMLAVLEPHPILL